MIQINRILVAIDRSAMAEEALKRAISIAKEKEAQLTIMHVIESSYIESIFEQSIDKNEIKKEIEEQVEKLSAENNIEYVIFIESGSAISSIAHKVKDTGTDLLILGTHGKNDISSNYFGSTTLKLIQKTRIPVLIIKNKVIDNYKKMLAATNLSDYSKVSILFARSLLSTPSLKYLNVSMPSDELGDSPQNINSDKPDQLKKDLLSNMHIKLEQFVQDIAEGEMALIPYNASINEDLLAYIEKDDSDLLILGSKGVGNLNSFLFGSTASYLVQNVSTDVLVYVPVIMKTNVEKQSEEEIRQLEEAEKPSISPIQKDLESRKEEIMDDLEDFFEENLKYTNWNVPEAPDQEVAERLVAILAEKLNEINQKVKDGRYQEKRSDMFK